MNALDLALLRFVNSFAGRSWALDRAMLWVSQSDLLMGSVATFVFWRVWFRRHPEQARRREMLLAAIGGAFLALAACRVASLWLPFRERPIRTAGLDLVVPIGVDPKMLHGWSAFPSDHATLAFALAAGIGLASRTGGIVLVAQAMLICLPRVFLGLHFPGDILGGAVLGVGAAWVAGRSPAHAWFTRPMLAWEGKSPAAFYPAMILVTMQIADMVGDLRALATLATRWLRTLPPG